MIIQTNKIGSIMIILLSIITNEVIAENISKKYIDAEQIKSDIKRIDSEAGIKGTWTHEYQCRRNKGNFIQLDVYYNSNNHEVRDYGVLRVIFEGEETIYSGHNLFPYDVGCDDIPILNGEILAFYNYEGDTKRISVVAINMRTKEKVVYSYNGNQDDILYMEDISYRDKSGQKPVFYRMFLIIHFGLYRGGKERLDEHPFYKEYSTNSQNPAWYKEYSISSFANNNHRITKESKEQASMYAETSILPYLPEVDTHEDRVPTMGFGGAFTYHVICSGPCDPTGEKVNNELRGYLDKHLWRAKGQVTRKGYLYGGLRQLSTIAAVAPQLATEYSIDSILEDEKYKPLSALFKNYWNIYFGK